MSKALQLTIRAIGNSKGIVIPKSVLEQVGLEETVNLAIDGEKLVLTKPKSQHRKNWAADAIAISKAGEDSLLFEDIVNQDDKDWVW